MVGIACDRLVAGRTARPASPCTDWFTTWLVTVRLTLDKSSFSPIRFGYTWHIVQVLFHMAR